MLLICFFEDMKWARFYCSRIVLKDGYSKVGWVLSFIMSNLRTLRLA